MKFQLVVFQLICLTVAWARTAVEDDLEEAPVQPFKPVKPNPLKSSKSIPVPTKKTTTLPPEVKPEPEQEPEYEDDPAQKEYEDEPSQSSTTSTTEAPRKLGQKVRPFRSNQDLLETLKRRRAEKAAAGPQFAAPPTTSAPAAAAAPAPRAKGKPSRAYNGRSRPQSPEEPDQAGSESEKTTVNRRFSGARGRSSFSSTTPAYEEAPEEAPAPPPRNRNFGRSRRV